jgi:hypothetical protein
MVPIGWPRIFEEAEGFNVVLGLFLCSIATERHRHNPSQWVHECHWLVRAALARRPCMGARLRDDIVQEFDASTLFERWTGQGRPDASDPLGSWIELMANSIPDEHWRRAAALPERIEDRHSCSWLIVSKGAPSGPWTSLWGAVDCSLELFNADPIDCLSNALDWSQGPRSFEFAQARLQALTLKQALAPNPCAPCEIAQKNPQRL